MLHIPPGHYTDVTDSTYIQLYINIEYRTTMIKQQTGNFAMMGGTYGFICLFLYWEQYMCSKCDNTSPDRKVRGANMGPIWGRQDPCGPHVGPMNLAIGEVHDIFVITYENVIVDAEDNGILFGKLSYAVHMS